MVAKTTKSIDVEVEGLNELLRDLRAFPKDANKELRIASQRIANQHMVPAWRRAAGRSGPWADKIQQTIRAKKDRLPTVIIGAQRPRYGRGATPNTVRRPSDAGVGPDAALSAQRAFKEGGSWMKHANRAYVPAALREWAEAVQELCDRFNADRRGVG